MPHRNKEDLINLDRSLKKLSNSNKSKHIILAGDFNCPDINWENLTVRSNAPDREVQQALIYITHSFYVKWTKYENTVSHACKTFLLHDMLSHWALYNSSNTSLRFLT